MLNEKTDKTLIVDVETTGLSPYDSRLTVISTNYAGEIQSFYNIDEKRMLQDFWQYVKDTKIVRLCAYNASFDISFLNIRSLLHSVEMKTFDKWKGVIDAMNMGQHYGKSRSLKFQKMHDTCAFFGFEGVLTELKGSEMPELFLKGDIETIRIHCEDDVRQTYKIFKRALDCKLIQEVYF